MDQEMDFELGQEYRGQEPSETFSEKVVWFLKGFVYPLWSRDFYVKAARKGMGPALIFLLGFALLHTIITTATIAVNLSSVRREIEEAYQAGELPDIRIENGLATVSGTGQYLLEDNRQFVGIDTTGDIREIDTNRFSEGLLLTRTEIHLVNQDGYQVLPLSDLNDIFGDPIVLDGASVTRLWSGLAVFINAAVLFGGFLWFSVGRFAYLALLGLLVWGAVSLGKKRIDFAPILVAGIYANVPTTYAMFLLQEINFTFCGLRAVILLIIWGLAVSFILKDQPANLAPAAIPGDFE